jgi:hypothetical protein
MNNLEGLGQDRVALVKEAECESFSVLLTEPDKAR